MQDSSLKMIPRTHKWHQRLAIQSPQVHHQLARKFRQKAAVLSADWVLVLQIKMQSLCSQTNDRLVAAIYKKKVIMDSFRSINVPSFLKRSEDFVNASQVVNQRPDLQFLQLLPLQHQRPDLRLLQLHDQLVGNPPQKAAALSADWVLVLLLIKMQSLCFHKISQDNHRCHAAFYKKQVIMDSFSSKHVPTLLYLYRKTL